MFYCTNTVNALRTVLSQRMIWGRSYVRQNTTHKNRFTPIQMTYNSYDGMDKIATVSGDSPIIIMHGLFGSKNNWNSLSKALCNCSKRQIIAVDARNHGDSPHTEEFSYHHLAADIKRLMSDLNIGKCCLLGHSMGGRAVMMFALTYPELVEKLIVVDISPVSSSPGIVLMNKYFSLLKLVKLNRQLTIHQARQLLNDQLMESIPEVAVRNFLLTNLSHIKDDQYKWKINLESLSKSFENNIVEFPAITTTCDVPTLFIGGLKSDYVRVQDHAAVRKFFPNANFQHLDAGHWVHAEKPTEFLSAVCDFISKDEK